MNTKPTQKLITNAALVNWEYIGGGIFVKDEHIGYFLGDGGFYYE